MGNHSGNKLGYKQEIMDEALDRAKAECEFSDRLYEILLAFQTGKIPTMGAPSKIAPPGNVGELNPAMSRLYNSIWSAALPLNDKTRSKPKQKQMEVIA